MMPLVKKSHKDIVFVAVCWWSVDKKKMKDSYNAVF